MILGEIFKCVFLETEYDGHVKFFCNDGGEAIFSVKNRILFLRVHIGRNAVLG